MLLCIKSSAACGLPDSQPMVTESETAQGGKTHQSQLHNGYPVQTVPLQLEAVQCKLHV